MSEKIFYKTEYKDIDAYTDVKTLINDLKVRDEEGYTLWEIVNYSSDDDPVYRIVVSRSRPETEKEKQDRIDQEYAAYKHLKKRYLELKERFEPD